MQVTDIPTWYISKDSISQQVENKYQNKSLLSKQLDYEDDIIFYPDLLSDIQLHKQLLFYKHNKDINKKISLWKGDITSLYIDAITNAARTSLLGGGGIDGKIHKIAGDNLKNECSLLGPIDYGEVRITPSFGKLQCNWILHGVGPRSELHKDMERRKLLTNVYLRCLSVINASHNKYIHRIDNPFIKQPNIKEKLLLKPIKTIAICCFSVGAFRCPLRDSTHIALKNIREWMEKYNNIIDRIIINVYTDWEWETYSELMLFYFP